ncbi:uncharacterized protein KY384_000341 [Bacidia gigantensis]|uniref:uncharacterized protein n=1 Tax=Bacidia gigantensis TaxID=2732470 RepID=UPI001D03E4E3|nr:uncharacterized protein KY384_000341 [Bacidia gigantensis]KAG8526348.1 hypothetical protein KY384_000341 [Bacidia gigantensis]
MGVIDFETLEKHADLIGVESLLQDLRHSENCSKEILVVFFIQEEDVTCEMGSGDNHREAGSAWEGHQEGNVLVTFLDTPLWDFAPDESGKNVVVRLINVKFEIWLRGYGRMRSNSMAYLAASLETWSHVPCQIAKRKPWTRTTSGIDVIRHAASDD